LDFNGDFEEILSDGRKRKTTLVDFQALIPCKIKENEKREQGRGREQETEGNKKRTLRQVNDYISVDFIASSVTRVSNI